MSLMTLLEQAQGGRLFANVARHLDLDDAQTEKAMRRLCPAIAERLKQKAAADDGMFQTLLDIVEDNGQSSPLEDADALTGPEAVSDGNAILDDVYGSRNAAMVALREADPAIPERELSKLAPISATAVVAALAAANRPMGLSGALPAAGRSTGEGFMGAFISAIIAGIVAALAKRFRAPPKRRSTGYARTRSTRRTTAARPRTTTRRKTTNATVEDIFRDILGNLGK